MSATDLFAEAGLEPAAESELRWVRDRHDAWRDLGDKVLVAKHWPDDAGRIRLHVMTRSGVIYVEHDFYTDDEVDRRLFVAMTTYVGDELSDA